MPANLMSSTRTATKKRRSQAVVFVLFLALFAVLIPLQSRTAEAADFASTITAVTKSEHSTYSQKHECDNAQMSARVGDYWANLGLPYDGCDRGVPWSAAFVSMMMSDAGAGAQFRYSSAHRVYIHDAFAGGRGLYGSVVDANAATARAGDLICSGRSYVGDWDYADFKNWFNAGGINSQSIPTHCDIVVSASGGKVTVVGGNVNQRVTKKTVSTSSYAILLPVTASASPPEPPSPAPSGPATGPIVGKGGNCLDLPYQNTANGTDLWMWDCNGTVAQEWTIDDGEIRVMGKCLDIEGRERKGSDMQITLCGYTGDLQWYVTSAGEIKSERFPALCLDIRNGSTARKARVQMWTCNGTAAQQWVTPA